MKALKKELEKENRELKRQLKHALRQRDILGHMMSGGEVSDVKLKTSGCGIGARIDLEHNFVPIGKHRAIQQELKDARAKIHDLSVKLFLANIAVV